MSIQYSFLFHSSILRDLVSSFIQLLYFFHSIFTCIFYLYLSLLILLFLPFLLNFSFLPILPLLIILNFHSYSSFPPYLSFPSLLTFPSFLFHSILPFLPYFHISLIFQFDYNHAYLI